MDVRTSIEGRSPNRHPTVAGSFDAALHLPAAPGRYGIGFDALEIFKKTPGVADLKPRGRYVAKDIVEIAVIPPLLHTLLGFDAGVGTPDVKFTDAGRTEHKTKRKLRATNPASGALWKNAQQIGPAMDGAVSHPGGAHEKQCYADI